MSPLEYNCAFWPPSKESFLSGLDRPFAQAIVKHIDRGCVSGLSYRVQGERVYMNEKPRILYFIRIDSWEYSIRNESSELPILHFSYMDAGLRHEPLPNDVRNVFVMGKPIRRAYRLSDKTTRVASYLMSQIARGHVPDAQRVLSGYKLIPASASVAGFFQNSFSYANGLFKENY